jgi:hypothetical protein
MKIIIKEQGQPIEVMNLTDQIGGGTGDVLAPPTNWRMAELCIAG